MRVAVLGVFFMGLAMAQTLHSRTEVAPNIATVSARMAPLTVERGFPLRLILTGKLPFKANQPVRAKVVDPIYAFDREVVPPGSIVTGRISALESVPRRKRVIALLGGDFTPLREPKIEFDTLTLQDGERLPVETAVTPGSGTVVRFEGGKQKKGRVASAKAAAHQQIDARKRAVIEAVKAPGKLRRLEDALLLRLPYHPQWLPAGTRLDAELLAPLQFGHTGLEAAELSEAGTQPAPDSVVYARLSTGLDSRTAHKGMPVEAVLSRPLFSSGHHLLFPEGSLLHGSVVQARAARHWHRNGQLRFLFQGIEPPAGSPREEQGVRRVEGRLESVEVASKQNVKMDEEGGAKVANSKKRFLLPAVTLMLANRGLDNDPVRVHGVPTGARQANPGGRALSGVAGFGLVGSALAQISRPFAATLGFYGAGWSIYTNLIGRGQDVSFPAETPIEIRFGARQ